MILEEGSQFLVQFVIFFYVLGGLQFGYGLNIFVLEMLDVVYKSLGLEL